MTETIYTLYPVFAATRELRDRFADEKDRARAAGAIEELFKRWGDDVRVRGTYSTVGFRSDADLMLWLSAGSAEELQRAVVEFRRTELGDRLTLAWAFMGVVKPAEFAPDHRPAFVKGDPPQTYLCVYPFVRTPEWYLLPKEERAALLRDHGAAGREFPEVLGNTTNAFGLGDWEWILAFESSTLDSIVEVIRRLRETEARRYVKVEVSCERLAQQRGGVIGNVGVQIPRRSDVAVVGLAWRELDLRFRLRLPRDLREQMRDAVEPRALLVVGFDDEPRRFGDVGVDEHLVFRA